MVDSFDRVSAAFSGARGTQVDEPAIRPADFDDSRLHDLLRHHMETIAPTAPKESRHALDLSGLMHPSVTLWCLWQGESLAGIGGLKELSPEHGEVNSMRTAPDHLLRGVGRRLLAHIEATARERGYRCLSLETGAMAFFDAAVAMYRSAGFVDCEPFAEYRPDPNSRFLTKPLLPQLTRSKLT